MKFEEILPSFRSGKIIKIKKHNWCLISGWDKNLQSKSVYISTNEYVQAWNPQDWQLNSDDWEIVE